MFFFFFLNGLIPQLQWRSTKNTVANDLNHFSYQFIKSHMDSLYIKQAFKSSLFGLSALSISGTSRLWNIINSSILLLSVMFCFNLLDHQPLYHFLISYFNYNPWLSSDSYLLLLCNLNCPPGFSLSLCLFISVSVSQVGPTLIICNWLANRWRLFAV